MNALLLANRLHSGQVDQGGVSYLRHVLRVAGGVRRAGGTQTQVTAAYLHDSIEDTEATPELLRDNGISDDVIALVVALTHLPNEPYSDYLDRVIATPGAALIKYHDIADNLNADRLRLLDFETQQRLLRKYTAAFNQLGKLLSEDSRLTA